MLCQLKSVNLIFQQSGERRRNLAILSPSRMVGQLRNATGSRNLERLIGYSYLLLPLYLVQDMSFHIDWRSVVLVMLCHCSWGVEWEQKRLVLFWPV